MLAAAAAIVDNFQTTCFCCVYDVAVAIMHCRAVDRRLQARVTFFKFFVTDFLHFEMRKYY